MSLDKRLEEQPHGIPILCPSCSSEMEITQTPIGIEFKCRKCGRVVYFSED